MPAQELLEQIQSTVSSACQQIDQVSPVWFDPPYAWEVRYIYPHRAPTRKTQGVRIDQIDAHTILYRSDDMLQLLDAR